MLSPVSVYSSKPTSQGFAVSVGLHALAAALLFGIATRSPAPMGSGLRGSPLVVELAHHSGPTNTELPKIQKQTRPMRNLPKPKLTGELPVVAAKPYDAVAQPASSAPLGATDGTTSEGPSGVENGIDASTLERYLYDLRVLIAQRKIYPSASKRLGEMGRVVVKFEIDREGRIEQPSLQTASAYSRLNEAALQLVSQIERYKPIPDGHRASKLAVAIPIDYIIN